MRLPRTTASTPARGATSAAKPPRRFVLVALVALACAFALGFALRVALTGHATGEPLPSTALQALVAEAPSVIVYSEFGEFADTLWAADPAEPRGRVNVATVPHARGFAIAPSLSPDGSRIAYTVRPPEAGAAELWLLTTTTGASERLASGVDLASAPVWSPTSDAVVVRRSSGDETSARAELLRVDLAGRATTIATADAALYSIDFSRDGRSFYYAVLSSAGTDLARASAAGGAPATTVAHLSDGFSRDWHLSPDGGRLSFLAQDAGAAFGVRLLTLSTGAVDSVGTGAAFNPVWEPDGGLTVSTNAGAPLRIASTGAAAATSPTLAAPDFGFDVPIVWSPDGSYVVVRHFEGASAADPGPSHIVAVGTAGSRRALSSSSDVAVAGWLEGAG